MKKSLMYLLIALVLGGLCWYYFTQDDNASYSKSEANFNMKDSNDIVTIFLSNLKNENVKISRTADGWILNDSLDVRTDAVSGLLRVLYHQYPEKPVPSGYHNSAIKELSARSTKIEIYTKEGKTNSFFVAQTPGPNNSTYMLTEGAKRPFVVKLPLENNFVGIRYFTGVDEWRSKRIMYAPHPVQSVNLSYADSVQHSFEMKVVQADSVQVLCANQPSSAMNKRRVNAYLGFLDKIYCTGFESQYRFKDSVIQKGKKMATLTIQRENKPKQTLTFYFKRAGHDTKSVLTLNGIDFDANYFFAWLNERDILIMNRNATQTLLRTGQEFFQADQK